MASRGDDRKQLRCSFCNKTQDQVRKLIAGPNVYICDECIDICSEIIEEEFDDMIMDESGINLSAATSILKILEGTVASVPPQGGRKHPHQEFIQIDTTNILFICGGAFDGLEKIIETRIGKKSIGFNAEVESKSKKNVGELFKQVLPQDFVKFGLIPEFVGRVPVSVGLDLLDEEALVRILTEPKNAITKQYKKLFELDGVELKIEEDAIREIASRSVKRKTGARGLRAIMETVMMDSMYRIPSEESVTECIITKESVEGLEQPVFVYGDGSQSKRIMMKKASKKASGDIA
ncbi:atp-dependent clp protease atp-binding subunit clpx-like mitochondrial-related [Holotrichia oblita]|nr:atp-dependent clp protease atp-binding subunit clpx-like mitochondrial-related [Holotrichia oblita]